jgi:prepilin-type processing-associated H-X9-DG protein
MYRSDYINPDNLPKNWVYKGKRFDARPARLGLLYEEFQNYDDPASWAPKPPNLYSTLNDGFSGFIVDATLGLNWEDYISVWHLNTSNMVYFDGHLEQVDAIKVNKKANRSQYAQWAATGGPK